MTTETHPPKEEVAEDHCIDAFVRGTELGALAERERIITLLRSPELQDQVWNRWQGDEPIYDVLASYLQTQGEEAKL